MAITNYSDPARFAGVAVTTTGKYAPKGDGTDGLAILASLVDQSGNPVGAGTSGSPSVETSQGNASLATAQVSVATTNTQIAAARATRNSITVTNTGTTAVYVGNTGVTTSTGMLLPGVVGASITIPTTAALFGVVGTGTQTVAVLETY